MYSILLIPLKRAFGFLVKTTHVPLKGIMC